MMPQSPSKKAPWDLTQFSQLSAVLSYFPESHLWSEISSFSKVILVLGKARSLKMPNLGYRGAWVHWVIWCFTKNLCMRRDAWVGMLSGWSCQSLAPHSCGLLSHPNSFHGGTFKPNTNFDADSLLYSLSHFEGDTYTRHVLSQWCPPPPLTSTVKSSLFTHVHSSPLSLAAGLQLMLYKLFSLC